MSTLKEVGPFALGYAQGRRDAMELDQTHVEQDFAYKDIGYERGYREGYEDGRRLKLLGGL